MEVYLGFRPKGDWSERYKAPGGADTVGIKYPSGKFQAELRLGFFIWRSVIDYLN